MRAKRWRRGKYRKGGIKRRKKELTAFPGKIKKRTRPMWPKGEFNQGG